MKDIPISEGIFIVRELDCDGTNVFLYGKLQPNDCSEIIRELRDLQRDMRLSKVMRDVSNKMWTKAQALDSYLDWKSNLVKP